MRKKSRIQIYIKKNTHIHTYISLIVNIKEQKLKKKPKQINNQTKKKSHDCWSCCSVTITPICLWVICVKNCRLIFLFWSVENQSKCDNFFFIFECVFWNKRKYSFFSKYSKTKSVSRICKSKRNARAKKKNKWSMFGGRGIAKTTYIHLYFFFVQFILDLYEKW